MAIVIAGLGFAIGLGFAVHTANNEPRPKIISSLSGDGREITVEIDASGLPTHQRLAFRVDLLRERNVVGYVYESYLGPDADGNVDQAVTVPLPKTGYTEIGVMAFTGNRPPHCAESFGEAEAENEFADGASCTIIALPEFALR